MPSRDKPFAFTLCSRLGTWLYAIEGRKCHRDTPVLRDAGTPVGNVSGRRLPWWGAGRPVGDAELLLGVWERLIPIAGRVQTRHD